MSTVKKKLIYTVKGGETHDKTLALDEKYDNENTVYVILKSTGKCTKGDFEFEYN